MNRDVRITDEKRIKRGKRRKKKLSMLYVAVLSLAFLFVCILILMVWTYSCEPSAHRQPSVQRVDIGEILKKENWNSQDYEILTAQTGLSGEVLQKLEEQGRREELFTLQEEYFRPVSIRCEPNSIISKEEYVADEQGRQIKGMSIPYVEEGDILITFCSHAFGWRNGHAGLIVDAERRLVLEAQVLGSPSVITSLDHWESYPSFIVLRLKDAGREERAAVAAYAKENLKDVSYRLTAGIWDTGEEEMVSGTQCAHLVWYAYQHFGYDLDSDGGLIVTPNDLFGSDKLMVIQKFGM